MPHTRTTICDTTAASGTSRNSDFDCHSFFSLPQQEHHMSTVAAAMTRRPLPSSPTLKLYGDNDSRLFHIRSSTTGNIRVDRVIAILDAAVGVAED
jgi:hypothetical protein